MSKNTQRLSASELAELRTIRDGFEHTLRSDVVESYIRDGYAVRKGPLGVLLTDAGKAALREGA